MRLSIVLSTFFIYLALGSPSDILHIEKNLAEGFLFLDTKDFSSYGYFFTKNATYDVGNGTTLVGLDDIESGLADIVKNYLTLSAVFLPVIRLEEPFDQQGGAFTAHSVSYSSTTSFGDPNRPKNSSHPGYSTILGRSVDEFVKTNDRSRFDGWRINKRVFSDIVSAKYDIVQRYLCKYSPLTSPS